MSDYYFDDPIEETPAPQRKVTPVLASIMLLIATTFFFKTTLASNITLSSSGPVEFGQGITLAAACSGSSALTVTPAATFSNSSGGGAHYFSSVTVSGIPSSCNGVDFNISAYNTTGNALAIFNTTSTVASIWDNGNSFQGGKGWIGSTIISGSGSFTVSFTTPVALASSVAKISLQSMGHQAGNCITENVCALGDTGPGGGLVFYVGAAFTMTGATCNTSCYYLEWAPVSWASTQSQNASFFEPGTATTDAGATLLPVTLVGTSTAFGSGLNNTTLLATATPLGSSSTNAAIAARLYAATDSSAGQWFIPSRDELIAQYNSVVKSRGNFQARNLMTSSEQTPSTNYFIVDQSTGAVGAEARGNAKLFRPIRAF